MVLKRPVAGGVLAVVLALGGSGVMPAGVRAESVMRVAQVTPERVHRTRWLDENSPTRPEDGSYYAFHEFEGTAGEVVRIDLVSYGFDTYLLLRGPDGNLVAQSEDGRDGWNALLAVELPMTGRYQVTVNTYAPGEVGQYMLGWQLTAAPSIVANSVVGRLDTSSQNFSDGTYFNVHVFEATSGDPILLEMTSDDFDASLILVKPNGEILASYDGGGEGTDVRFMLRLPDTGTYQLYAGSSTFVETGAYRLSWRALTPIEAANLPSFDQSYYGDRFPQNTQLEFSLEDGGMAAFQNTITTEMIPVLEEELDILRARLGDNNPEVADNLSILAGLYSLEGRYSDARIIYLEALDIYRALPNNYSEEEAEILDFLRSNAYLSGEHDEGDAYVNQAEAIREEAGISLRAYDESSLIQAIETNRETAEPHELHELAVMARELGADHHRQGRYEEAEALYKEAIELSREGRILPIALNDLALLYQAQGLYGEAESLYREAIEANNESIASTVTRNSIDGRTFETSLQVASVVPILYNLAGLYRATNDIAQANSVFLAALDIEQQDFDFNFANLGETNRLAYVATQPNTLNYILSFNLDTAPNSTEATQLALTTLLRRKGRILEAGVRTQETFRQYATPDELDLLDQLTRIQQEISSLAVQPPVNLSASEYQIRMVRLRSDANQLEAVLARRSSDLALESQSIELEAVKAQIPDNGVLIEYAAYRPFDPTNPLDEQGGGLAADRFGNPRYAAYLLFPNGQIEIIDLGDAAKIDAAVQSFTGLLQNPGTDLQRATAVPTLRPEVIEEVTTDIRSLVFDPIAPYLQDVDHLLISPDGQLNLLPFEALQPETGGEYLVQQYQISYLNSGRDLLKFDVIEPSRNPAVVLANPDYETAAIDTRRSAENRRSNDISQLQVGALPGTAREAEAIAPLLPNAQIFTEENATENALKSVQTPRILHIATHGFFLEDQPIEVPDESRGLSFASTDGLRSLPPVSATAENPLLRSGLALAGFNARRSGDEDGVFTALEASQLNLFGTQLVVLSACDTGLGDVANGEGVYGLRRAFAIAGAETQLLSLWQVSDAGTQSLMAQYYENLVAGIGRSDALRQVQLDMIEAGGQYSHPYYWAAFILSGDWEPLE